MKYTLVQSGRFPNVWSLNPIGEREGGHIWRDPIFANGAMAAENAVTWARENDHQIVKIESSHWNEPGDMSAREVIAGIEYRSMRPILDRYDWVRKNSLSTEHYHVMGVYPTGTASVIVESKRWHEEMSISELEREQEFTPAEIDDMALRELQTKGWD